MKRVIYVLLTEHVESVQELMKRIYLILTQSDSYVEKELLIQPGCRVFFDQEEAKKAAAEIKMRYYTIAVES